MNKFVIYISLFIVMLILAGCSEARRDPCHLLTVEDVRSVDDTVVFSLWAGRDGERKEDEVCIFYADDDDPRVMLFVWYDKENDPKKLTTKGVADTGARIVDLPGIGLKAAAAYKDDELKLLAVQSTQGMVGLRVRKSVMRDSADFDEVVQLAERALSRH